MKYTLTSEQKIVGSLILHRVKYADGTLGGWIEKESNLSQEGDARVHDNAWVYGDARVYGDAWVYGDARVYGDAWVYDNAWVYGNARVYGDAWVYDNAHVYGDARVQGNARVSKYTSCIVVTNLKYPLTVTPQNIVIGCQIKTFKEWMKVTKLQAVKMGLKATSYKTFKSLLPILNKQAHS